MGLSELPQEVGHLGGGGVGQVGVGSGLPGGVDGRFPSGSEQHHRTVCDTFFPPQVQKKLQPRPRADLLAEDVERCVGWQVFLFAKFAQLGPVTRFDGGLSHVALRVVEPA